MKEMGRTNKMTARADISDIRIFLQSELARRCRVNPKYSLRAFAKTLQMESSMLSKLLSGKRAITETSLIKIASRLGLPPEQVETFKARIVEMRGRPSKKPKMIPPEYHQLTLDTFQMISDWYHYAILELISVSGFQPSSKWIARELGISVPEVKDAVERLCRLDFLEITAEGKWIDRSGDITTVGNEFTAVAHRKLQKQILEKAILALEEVPIECRDNSGMTMAIDLDRLPEAKVKIRNFRRELTAFLQGGKQKHHVFHFGLALYPVTKIKGEK